MNVLTFGVAILSGLLALWLLGGVVLRIGGLLLALVGGFGIGLQHDANGLFVLAIGALLWLAGHWHYALRHHEYKSPLAGYVFGCWAPEWLDPTRDWAIPVADSEAERRTP
ncbi:MAG: hypothetical protein ACRDLL_01740 [Solirubrobacterales bacterium]